MSTQRWYNFGRGSDSLNDLARALKEDFKETGEISTIQEAIKA
jgi:hypothetical protein